MRSGDEHLAPQPLRRGPCVVLRRRRLDPGVLDDRRAGGSCGCTSASRRPAGRSRSRAWSPGVELVPHLHQLVDLVDRLALGVQAVQLDVLEGPLDLDPLGSQAGRQVGLLAPQRQRLQQLLAPRDRRLGPVSAGPGPGHGRGTGTPARRSAGPRRRRSGARVNHPLTLSTSDAVLQRVDAARRHLARWPARRPVRGRRR